jgi:hypothetical protein
VASRRLVDASSIGTATHQLIGLLALRHAPGVPAVWELKEAARALLCSGRSPSARQSMRVGGISLAGVYLARFWPRGARLVACELVVGDSALDLLWLLGDSALFADELKTGIAACEAHEPTVAQANAQAQDGALVLGESFIGVRVALLRRPADSFFVATRSARDERRPPPIRFDQRWAPRAQSTESTDDS